MSAKFYTGRRVIFLWKRFDQLRLEKLEKYTKSAMLAGWETKILAKPFTAEFRYCVKELINLDSLFVIVVR